MVDINRISRSLENRLALNNVVSDIAVLSKDFKRGNQIKGKAYGFIEVKAAGILLRYTDQIKKEKSGTRHLLFTNGVRWIYYLYGVVKKDCSIVCDKPKCTQESAEIDEDAFDELIIMLSRIQRR